VRGGNGITRGVTNFAGKGVDVEVAVGVAVGVTVTVGVRVRVGARSEAEVGRKRLKRSDKLPAASSRNRIVSSLDPRVFKIS
jgi:hypothetical protein